MRTKTSGGKSDTDGAAQPRLHTVLFAVAAVIALAGLADAAYLAAAHLAGEHVACGGNAQCSTVLSSKYATFAGLPLALFGAIGYFSTFSFATLAAFEYTRVRLFLALTVTAMFGATLWLLYVQAFILHAFCTYCLLSAACTFLLAGVILVVPPRR